MVKLNEGAKATFKRFGEFARIVPIRIFLNFSESEFFDLHKLHLETHCYFK